MMRVPPGVPETSQGRSSLKAMIGVMVEITRLPGSGAFAGSEPPQAKLAMASLRKNPVPGAMTWAPNDDPRVKVLLTTFPSASATE